MPTLIPDTLYDTRQAVESGEGVLVSGMWWYNAFQTSQPGQNDCFLKTTDIIEMSAEELADLDETIITHYDAATGIKKKLFSFGSGVDFYVSVFIKTETLGQTTLNSVCVAGCIKYNGVYTYNIGGLAEAGGIAWGVSNLYNPVNLAKTYGLKFELITNYTYGLGKAELGVTKAAYFDVMAYIPGVNTGSASGFQSWGHIHSDGLYFTSRVDDPDMSDWVYNPQYFYYGYTDNTVTTYMPVLRTDDLGTFYEALRNLNPFLQDPFKIVDGDEPSQETDPSGPGGGGGNMDKGSDPVDFPGLPTGGALSSGAVKAFDITTTAITQMFMKLWDTSIFDISTFQKLVQEPLDALITLQCIPINPTTSGTGHVKLGNFDTEAIADIITQQYYTIDCGSLTVQEYWGSALDYSPYSKLQIFLPFIGIRDLDIDECMGKKLHVKYNYDILSGNFTAQIKVGSSVLYKFPGNVKQEVPVTSQVNTKLEALARSTSTLVAGAAGGGASFAAAVISSAVNTALAKTRITRSGDLNGSTGLLDDFNCYLIITRPIQSLAAGFKSQKGYPSNISAVLNTCSGYTEVEYIHLTGIAGATDTELEEIEQLLKNGVII